MINAFTTPGGLVTVEARTHADTEREAVEALIAWATARLGEIKEPTLEEVVESWEAGGGYIAHGVDRTEFRKGGHLVAVWDAAGHIGIPMPVWRRGTLNDLRRALGLEVKR